MTISLYPNCKGRNDEGKLIKREVPLARAYTYITEGQNNLKVNTEVANKLSVGDTEVYKDFKATLPAAMFSGTASDIPPTTPKFQVHSGYVTLDFDNVTDTASLKADLAQAPEVRLCFISPSGQGVKAVVEVTPHPTDEVEHRHAWSACVEHFSHLDAEVDPTGNDLRRLCFLAYDPQAYYRAEGPAVTWEIPDEPDEPEVQAPNAPYTGPIDTSILKYFNPNHYQTWVKVGMACKTSGLDMRVWEDWSRTSKKFQAGKCLEKWNSFNRSDFTWATLVKEANIAQQKDNPYFTDKGTFMPDVLARDLTESHGMHFLSIPTEHTRRVYADGIYRPDTGMLLEKTVRDILGPQLATASRISNVTTMVEIDSMIPLPPRGMQPCHHPNALNVRNGVLDLETMELNPHSHEDAWIHQLPVTFDPEATCPTFDAWLHDIQEGRLQDIDLAHEILGVSLIQRVIFPQVYFLHGASHTGKSTFLDVMTALIGEENISDVAFTDLGNKDDRFATASLVGKLANIDRDVSIAKLTDTGTVKKIAGGELISVQEKGKPRVSLRPYATIVMATNDMPKSNDWSDGWTARLCILSFQKTHMHAPDRDMVQKLTTDTEMSGILNHALAGLQRVVKTGQHTDSETAAANRKTYEEQNNVVVRWFNELYVRAPGEIPAADVEAHIDGWCDAEGIKRIKRNELRATLKRMDIKHTRKNRGGDRDYVYTPLAIKPPDAVKPDEHVPDEVPF